MVGGNLGQVAPDGPCAGADDAAPNGDAVRLGGRRRLVEPPEQLPDLAPEMSVERQLLRDDEQPDENDTRAAVDCEAAGEIESVLRLLAGEERHDNRPIPDSDGTAREALPAAGHSTWKGTLARITPGSSRSRRLT